MAFQTNVYVDGNWVTQTLDVNAVLKASAPKAPKRQRLLKSPQCGLLTRTVIESQLVNTILPVRLRSPRHNDIAFIGDHAVQIRELGRDGQLRHVIRKTDFGSRIRNAAVIGTLPDNMNDIKQERPGEEDKGEGEDEDEGKDDDEDPLASPVETDNDDVNMDQGVFPARATSRESLPSQLLLLVLECGDSAFLSVRTNRDGSLEFVTSRFKCPSQHHVFPGFHLAVDPSARYMVLGCAQTYFMVYELESMRTLDLRYRRDEPLRPVRSFRARAVQGVIHQIEFLYPRPGDDNHIILLLVVVKNGKSRMVTYEWELGDDLFTVFHEEKTGHRMPVENQMPLLLIPLTVCSAFIAISPSQIAVCTESLHGPPNFERIDITDAPATINYHGREKPLWTAWARPFRLSSFFKNRDCIYLAREDGVVIFIEFDAESILTGSIFMDKFDCNISAAFSCLYEQYSDILVMGGDSGPGAVWKVNHSRAPTSRLILGQQPSNAAQVPARQSLEQLSTLPNSCPVVDFVTTDEYSSWNDGARTPGGGAATPGHRQPAKPSRIFATSGRGQKGSVTEYRYGLQAKIGLDLEYGAGLKQAWVFPAGPRHDAGFHLVLSMPDQTAVLSLSADLSQASESEAGMIQYDTSSRTLAAAVSNDLIIQVTEKYIVLIGPSESPQFPYEMLDGPSSLSVIDAAILADHVAISTYADTRFQIYVLRVQPQEGSASLAPIASFATDGEITCLSLCQSLEDEAVVLLAGLWREGRPWLAYARLGENGQSDLEMVDFVSVVSHSENQAESIAIPTEPIASIATYVHGREQIIMLGMRSGEVVTLTSLGPESRAETQRFGVTAVNTLVSDDPGRGPFALVLCDSSLVLLSDYNPREGGGEARSSFFRTRVRVWPVDVSNPTSASPQIDSVTALPRNLFSERGDTTSLLLLSGSRILIAELQGHAEPVHRNMPLGGTPMRIIYSRYLQTLIVAVNKRDGPTLVFLDPDTGEDLGKPTDKEGREIATISGLGKKNDRIFGLAEWEYKKGDDMWRFILVSTREGRMIILSAQREEPTNGRPSRIRYWLRFKKPEFDRPVYSVLPYEEGIIYCVGDTIYWDVLDDDRKLKTTKSFDLGSPATTLRIANGKLLALTNRDSLEIIDHSTTTTAEESGLIHIDPLTRNGVHMIEVAGARLDEPMSSIILLSDRECGVGGLWVPWQMPGKDCESIIEADLPASIRKFRRGRTRPYWEQGWHAPKFGRMVSTVDDAEILGICLDGSLQHFTLLNVEVWRLLRFVQNLAATSPELYPFMYDQVNLVEFDPEPLTEIAYEKQVDGDMLQRCLEKRALERLISRPSHMSRFRELLDDLEDGKYTADFGIEGQGVREKYFELAYDILEYFLAPVL